MAFWVGIRLKVTKAIKTSTIEIRKSNGESTIKDDVFTHTTVAVKEQQDGDPL